MPLFQVMLFCSDGVVLADAESLSVSAAPAGQTRVEGIATTTGPALVARIGEVGHGAFGRTHLIGALARGWRATRAVAIGC